MSARVIAWHASSIKLGLYAMNKADIDLGDAECADVEFDLRNDMIP
jgi:hypothetical protein